ncbi:MAG: crossover junction endodeoxyribonuclease RuvC [Mobilicoccus sp.]|nr:crossover junction endodeoxyribonuclease RuvC [Mobilicoccus sp.]
MRVLAVDPGLTRCGLGVIEGRLGGPLHLVEVAVLRTPSGDPIHERLYNLQSQMEEWFVRHEPDAVAVERVFARSDVSTIMGTAQASALPMIAAARREIPLALHTPSEVKAAVTGNGRADKAQVTAMVTRILRLESPPKPADAADALALAVCHVWRGGAQSRIDAAMAAAGGRHAAAAARSRRAAAVRGARS